jgi:hypothetical protein
MCDTEDILFKHQEMIETELAAARERDTEVLSCLTRIEAAIACLSRDAAF